MTSHITFDAMSLYSQPKKGAVEPFSSDSEMYTAQRDPRYGKDREYTLQVDDRIEAMMNRQHLEERKAAEEYRTRLGTVQPFANSQELVAAYSDPRYNVDSEYTAQVHMRTEAADVQRENAERQAQASGQASASSPSPEGGPQPFRSWNERLKAYSDPQYQTDPDYRESVAQRDLVTPDFSS